MSRRQSLLLFALIAALVIASRFPLTPRQLFSFDDVNFAFAMGQFDLRKSQPHPPGYPLFVLQSRVLFKLGFKRPESNLLALSLLGSTLAVFMLARAGRRILGAEAATAGACLLLFNHSFWYCGLTSSLRPQLAVLSIGVAAACHRAWSGESRWAYWSSVLLGLGMGIRPELGVVLLPLWAIGVWRATTWGHRLGAAAVLAASVLAWFVPTILNSGGLETYLRLSWDYFADQATLTSVLFGASDSRVVATITWLIVWTFTGLLVWPLPMAFTAGRSVILGLKPAEAAFLALWFVPGFLFAIFVHVADAGHIAHLLPVVCLISGRMIVQAIDRLELSISRWHPLIFVSLPVILGILPMVLWPRQALLSIPLLCLAGGLILRFSEPGKGVVERKQLMAFLLAPALFLNCLIFFQPVWYYKGPPATGLRGLVEQVIEYAHSGLTLASLQHVRGTAWADDFHLQMLARREAERPAKTIVLWERGVTSWRKTSYYFPRLQIIVLEHKKIAADSPRVAMFRRGATLEKRVEGQLPLRVEVPAGSRLIWMVHPHEDFLKLLKTAFDLQYEEPLYYVDLPAEHGEKPLGDYLLAW